MRGTVMRWFSRPCLLANEHRMIEITGAISAFTGTPIAGSSTKQTFPHEHGTRAEWIAVAALSSRQGRHRWACIYPNETPRADTDPCSRSRPDYDASFTDFPRSPNSGRESMFWSTATFIRRYGARLACGTGGRPDVAQGGFHVIGADRSYGMLAGLSQRPAPWAKRIRTSYKWMRASLTMFRDSSFDAILSNFGGLNWRAHLRSSSPNATFASADGT